MFFSAVFVARVSNKVLLELGVGVLDIQYIDIWYILCNCLKLSVCIQKRQKGWTNRAPILCWTSHDPRADLRMLKITKICVQKILIFINFENVRKNILKDCKFFVVIVLYWTIREDAQDRDTIKTWNRRWAQSALTSMTTSNRPGKYWKLFS